MSNEPEVYWACGGHPAWPDPLRVYTKDRAVEWFNEYKNTGHPVWVDEITVVRKKLFRLNE